MRSTNDFLAFLAVYRAAQEVPGIQAREAIAMVRVACAAFVGLSQDLTYIGIARAMLARLETEHDRRATGRRKAA